MTVSMPVEALYARPRINFRHIDGPMLMWAGNIHWLTWRERFAVWLGRTDADQIARRYWPERADWAVEALLVGWEEPA